MKKILVLVVLGALIVGGYYWFHSTPEKAIRKRLLELAEVASFAGNESPLVKLANAQKLSSFCSVNVEVTVDLPGNRASTVSGRDEVLQAVAGVRQTLQGLHVEFLDITVQVSPDRTTATATLTARAQITGDRDEYIQELRFNFRKIDNDWLISEIQTIKTLTHFGGQSSGTTRPCQIAKS
jgi:ketosteroid isomerase-like protein